MGDIKRAYLFPTLHCNLKCKHCYSLRPKIQPGFNSKNVVHTNIFSVVSKLLSIGVEHFDISGGEPLLFPEIVELCQNIKQKKNTFITIVSNGTLLKNKSGIAIQLTSFVDQWVVSFESGYPNVHDNKRGANSFKSAIEGLRFLAELGVKGIAINTVLFPDHGSDGILSVLDIAKKVNVSNVHFMQLKWETGWEKEYLNFLEDCFKELANREDDTRIRFDVPVVFLRQLQQRWRPCLGSNIRIQSLNIRGSQAFNGEIIVAANGDITGDVDMLYHDEFKAGNLETQKTEKVVGNMKQFRHRILRRKQLLKAGHCCGCEFWHECSGGCPEMAVSLSNWEIHPDRRCPRCRYS